MSVGLELAVAAVHLWEDWDRDKVVDRAELAVHRLDLEASVLDILALGMASSSSEAVDHWLVADIALVEEDIVDIEVDHKEVDLKKIINEF